MIRLNLSVFGQEQDGNDVSFLCVGIRSSITPRCPVTGDVNREVTLIIGDDDVPLSFSRVTLVIFSSYFIHIWEEML